MVLMCFSWLYFLAEDILNCLEALVGDSLNGKALHKINVVLKNRYLLSEILARLS